MRSRPFSLIAAPAMLVLMVAGAVGASTQTAHFSGTIETLGSGFDAPPAWRRMRTRT